MQTYRARSSVVWGWGAIALGVLIAGLHVSAVGFSYATGGLGLGASAALFGYGAFLRPRIVTHEDHVAVHNVTHTATAHFSRLADLETRWALELVGDDGLKVGAFAAPAPGASSARRMQSAAHSADPDATAEYGRAGDRRGTPSGDAAAMVHAAQEAWRTAHPEAEPVDGPAIVKRPDWAGIALMSAALLAAAWGLLG